MSRRIARRNPELPAAHLATRQHRRDVFSAMPTAKPTVNGYGNTASEFGASIVGYCFIAKMWNALAAQRRELK